MLATTQFQTSEQLRQYLNAPRIECLECGRRMKKLGVHLRAKHGIDPDDYREKYGIPYSVGLACPEVRDAVREQVAAMASPARMKDLARLSNEKRRSSPNRIMRGAPIIEQAIAVGAANAREAMLEKERQHGPSAKKVAAAIRNIGVAATRLKTHGPTDKQRSSSISAGRRSGGQNRVVHSPETVAAVRAQRAEGVSYRALSKTFGIPMTSLQRICAASEAAPKPDTL